MRMKLFSAFLLIICVLLRPASAIEKLTVQLKLGTGIENHKLTGESETFQSGPTPIVAWTLIGGAQMPMEIKQMQQ